MKRSISSICSILAALCACAPSLAQSPDAGGSGGVSFDDVAPSHEEEVLELETIEIMDTIESDVRNGARPAFAQTIVEPHVQSVNDWLESVNGVYGDQTGKGTRSVMVRGFESRQLRIEFNGMPLETGYEGLAALDVLPMNWISAGRVAHADATPIDGVGLGGKLDFYAFDPSKLEAAVEVSRSGAVASVSHGMKRGAWRWAATLGANYKSGFYLSGDFKAADGEDGELRDSSEKKGANFLAKVGRTLSSWGDVELMAGWAQAPRDVPTGINTGTHRYWKFTNWRIAFASGRLRFETAPLTGQLFVWALDSGNTLEAFDDETRSTQTTPEASTSVWQDDDYGMKLELNFMPFDLHSAGLMALALRADLRYQRHASNEETYQPGATSSQTSSRFYYDLRPALEWMISPDVRVFAAGNVVGSVPVSQTSKGPVTDDVRLEGQHDGGFSVGVDYAILENLDLGLRAARRLRMPSLKEQFRNVPESLGVVPEKLLPEVAWDFEAELHWKPLDEVALTIGVFDIEIRDLIEFKYVNALKIAYNVSEARHAGVDVALKLGAWAGVSLDLSYHYLYAYDLSEAHELNDRPAHNVRAAVHYEPLDSLRLTLGASFESKRRTEAWMSTKYAWLGSVFLLNAEVEWHTEHFALYVRGTNLTDYNYMRAIGYPEEGVNVMVGGKVTY